MKNRYIHITLKSLLLMALIAGLSACSDSKRNSTINTNQEESVENLETNSTNATLNEGLFSDTSEETQETDTNDTTTVVSTTGANFLSSSNTNLEGVIAANYVSGIALEEEAYLFDGTSVTSDINLGSSSQLSIFMNIYIDDLKESKTVLLDSGSNSGNIKLSLVDNRASSFKDKDVALAFEIVGNNTSKVETKYRRFMEHELEYLQSQGHERRVNQLWLNLAVTYDSLQNKVDFYINGIHDSTHYLSFSPDTLIEKLSLGSDFDAKHKFYGKMANVIIENRLMSADEIYEMSDFRKNLWAKKYESSWLNTGTYYVDGNNGDDNNSGLVAFPFKTIGAAISQVESLSNLDAQGKHIVIKPGLYREGDLKLSKSGSVYKPIVIEAEEVGTVVVSGSDILDDNNWTSLGDDIWSHEWTEDFGRDAFSLPSSIDSDTEVRYHREVVALDGNLARPYPSLERLKNSTLHADASSFLSDSYGFHVDESNNLLYLRSNKNPNDSIVEVGKRDGLLEITGDYIVLKGITFKHDASFENTYSSLSGEAVKISGTHIFVEDCSAIDNGSDGVVFSPGSDLLVRRGEFLNNGRAGIITRRGYANAHLEGITVSYNQWRNDLGHYTSPDLSGYGKVMYASRIYLENSMISHHKNTGIWFDAQNMDITVDNCYFTQNDGALWFEISQLNLGLINSSVYDNNVVGVRIDSETVYLKNNVMSQTNLDGAWGIISTLYRDLRTEQMVPDVYLGKWLTMEDNTVAIKDGGGKLMFFNNSNVTGSNATSLGNTFYAPTTDQRIYSDNLSFSQWQSYFKDTSSQFVSSYPFTNDGSVSVEFEKSSLSVSENEKLLQVPAVLSKAVDANVTIELSIVEMGAIQNDDFKLLSTSSITFRPLERRKLVNLSINADSIDEDSERFSLKLSNPNNANLGTVNEISITIEDSDTSTIVEQKTHNAYARIEAENYDDYFEVSTIANVGFGRFRKNHWAMYENVDFGTTSASSVEVSIAVPDALAGRDFEIRLDSPTGQAIATLTTIATDSDTPGDERTWDEFKTVSVNLLQSVTGKHNVYIVNTADYQNACVVDWLVFEK